MGKRYYCDYCERSFADGAENRKKHLASVHHQKLRKAHYDAFKSAEAILEENKLKKPCRKFNQSGECDYGSGCKYSHLTAENIQELEELVHLEKLGATAEKPRTEPDIESWLKSKISKMEKHAKVNSTSSQPVLPPVLLSIPNLPPSLIPCNSSNTYCDKDAGQQWG